MDRKKVLEEFCISKKWSFVPVKEKKPLASWKEFQKRKPTNEEISKWNSYDFDRIGIICGKVSGKNNLSLEVIDIDAPQYFEFFKDIKTRVHKTPGGGYHLIFYSKVENKRTPKFKGFPIDLLGKNGFFIFGEGYKVEKDNPILEIEDTKKLLEERLPKINKSDYPKKSEDFEKKVEEFKNQINIEDILLHYGAKNLKKIGHYTVCRCPFDEGEHKYNSIINQDSYFCFTENKLRDVISIVQEKENCSFWEAIEKLEEITEVKFEREEKKFPELLSEFLQEHIDYLLIAKKFIEKHPLIYDKNHLFWYWNGHCYEMIDETDLLKIINEVSMFNGVINNKIKSQLIEAFKLEGRKQLEKVDTPKKTWIAFLNGIYDISTGEIIEPLPSYFITNTVPHNISNFEETPTIDKLFNDWYPQNPRLLYEICAYAMLDDYPIHRIFVLFGRGRNGKGTFIRLLKRLIGSKNCCSTDLYRLINSRFETARLYKKKLALLGETDYKSIERSDILKSLSGQDPIPAEYKNKPNFDFENYAKIVIATNSVPPTIDKTLGFYSRWIILKFEKIYDNNKDVLSDIPEWEYENMCRKCVKILKELLEKREFTGEGSYEDKERIYEELSNPILIFLRERCVKDPDGYIPKFEFKEQLEIFCKERGFRVMNDKEITKIMRDYGYENKLKRVDVDGEEKVWRCWLGLKWSENDKDLSPKDSVVTLVTDVTPLSTHFSIYRNQVGSAVTSVTSVTKSPKSDNNLPKNENSPQENKVFNNKFQVSKDYQLQLLKGIIEERGKKTIEEIVKEWNEFSKLYVLYDIYQFINVLKKEGILYEPKHGFFEFV